MPHTTIAIATQDGKTVAPHFGRASKYVVLTLEDGQVVKREERAKPICRHHHQGPIDFAQHVAMLTEPIRDCRVLIVGGIGLPAYKQLRALGYELYLTDGTIDEALQAYLEGRLTTDPTRVHLPHHGHTSSSTTVNQ